MKRLQKWRRHGLYLYRLFDHIFTRSQDYVERYIATGVRPENISIAGELRFDTQPDPALQPMVAIYVRLGIQRSPS